MKRMTTYMATGLLLIGVTGIAQAEGYYYDAREDCSTEGFPYNRDFKKDPIVPTKVVLEKGSLYIEGMGFPPRAERQKTIVPKVLNHYDFCSEGFSDEELENVLQVKNYD